MEQQRPTIAVENENTGRDRSSRSTEAADTSQVRMVDNIQPDKSQRKRRKYWDNPQDTREEDRYEASSDQKWARVYIVVTVIVRIIFCLVVLASAVISKVCFVLVVSNIFPPMGPSSTTTSTSSNSNLTPGSPMQNKCNLTSGLLTQKSDDNSSSEYWWRKTAGFSIRYKSTEMDVQWIWAMFLIIIAPYFFTLISGAWRSVTGKISPEPGWEGVICVILFETLDSIGVCFMAFVLLPNIDPIAVIPFCFSIAFTPGVICICCTPSTLRIRVVNIIGFLLQLASIGFACSYYALETKSNINVLYPLLFLVVTIFVSFNWWQNPPQLGSNRTEDQHKAVSQETSCLKANIRCVRDKIYNLVGAISDRRSKYSVIVSCWKIIITLLFPLTLFWASCVEGEKCIQTLFGLNTNASVNSIFGQTLLMSNTTFGPCHYNLPMITAAVGIICSGLCYRAVKLGFNILAQVPCVAVPLVLSTPVAVAALILILGRDTCSVCDLPYPYRSNDVPFASRYWMVIVSGLCGYASFVIITLHIWKPRNIRLQKSDELFTKPLYSGIFLVQSLQLNIRRVERTEPTGEFTTDMSFADSLTAMKYISKKTPRIYICATMWHETKSEMKKFMKSILRLDADHDKRKQFREIFGDFDDDFFTFEVHIMFDDAFRIKNDTDKGEALELNEYVKNFIDVVKETTNSENSLKEKTKTIYGGKLAWKLPFGCKMTAHLKNKSKIRARKRWSQVMYMYYILGHKLNIHEYTTAKDGNDFKQKVQSDDFKMKADNTYILALDGDVDFKPEAVQYLMDRMRKNPKVGAACGRIHPTGNGLLVWYQKFEYAMCHWLHKVTEDKMGGVLCSPGCFSLFRGSALIDDNVMNVYTTPAKEAWQHVQYDQGEDRWLCTLLLEQGYMIEYVAASDAFTEAPETFTEFFNQRRRWSPSTMANILDLLLDWRHVVKTNTNISNGYMLYQAFQMISSIVTPGTIFLMLVDALHTAFNALELWAAFLLTLIPIIIFIVACFNSRCEMQLKIASILSIAYSIIMMIVIVGLALHIGMKNICSTTTLFFILISGIFIISALLHPKEISSIIHGPLFFIAIPTASIIMFIYALCNLNETSWGTRESSKHSSIRKDRSLPDSISNWLGLRCSCCAEESNAEELSRRLERLESCIHHGMNFNENINAEQQTEPAKNDTTGVTEMTTQNSSQSEDIPPEPQESRKSGKGRWIRDKMLSVAVKKELEKEEKQFWKRMIRKYLCPLNPTEEEKETIHTDLTTLRNKVCLFFFLANAMFICVVFTLQQVASATKTLSIPFPCIRGSGDVEYVGPISFVFMMVFGILLFVQFICMLVHRFGTLIHICARTSVFESDDPNEENKTLYHDLCRETHDKPRSSKNQVSPLDRFRDVTNTIIERQTLIQRLEALIDNAKPGIQNENKRDQMKAIKKQFPNLSATSRRAMYRLLLDPSVKVKMANVTSKETEGQTPEQMTPIEVQ